jgi:hypothetical protein
MQNPSNYAAGAERTPQDSNALANQYVPAPMPPPAVRATLILAMAKPPIKEQTHSWSVYHIRGTPARLVGIVYAPDVQSAIDKTVEEFKVQANQRGRLIAERREMLSGAGAAPCIW